MARRSERVTRIRIEGGLPFVTAGITVRDRSIVLERVLLDTRARLYPPTLSRPLAWLWSWTTSCTG